MGRYVDLSETVTATYYDEQHEEWDHHSVTIEDVLSEVCDDYTVLPRAQMEIIYCKDCKYATMTALGQCKYCDIWFPDKAEHISGDYFCASAERRKDAAN